MNPGFIPWIGGAALAGCAVFFAPPLRLLLLTGLMLFYPFLDAGWRPAPLPRRRGHSLAWGALLAAIIALLAGHLRQWPLVVSTLALAALPEEWFFRAYFMERIGRGWRANLTATLLFALLHGLSRDWLTALLVIGPSLFYGWLYQRSRDLPLLILVHALSNLVFAFYLVRWTIL